MAIDTDDDRTADRAPPHPRSRIADVILADAPAHLDADAVDAVLEAAFRTTELACLDERPRLDRGHLALLDWSDYREVRI